ncbi:MAG: hypothetical protein WAL52_17030 [Candidatus Sulfotelmatobacter sp.]
MPKKIPAIDSPVFTIKLQKGLADLHRLPFSDVITVLEEVRQMIADMGRDIEHDLGIENPIGEFGLQLLAGPQGVMFKRGSIEAQVAITSNIETGTLAAKRVVDVINSLSNKKAVLESDAERSVVRRLNRINKISERDKTELHLVLTKPGEKKPLEATFNAAAAATAWSLQAPVFEMEGTTIYGKLFELRDSDFEDDNEKGFWGELCRENGEKWRIHFKTDSTQKATALFRKQVAVTGTAKYYRIRAPKLIAADITADEERDYEKAFEELFGRDRDIYGDDFQKALKEMRGED